MDVKKKKWTQEEIDKLKIELNKPLVSLDKLSILFNRTISSIAHKKQKLGFHFNSRRTKDWTNYINGYLEVLSFAHKSSNNIYWNCFCKKCNNNFLCSSAVLKAGKNSCGCDGKERFRIKKYKGIGDLSHSKFNHIKYLAKKRNIKFDLTIEQLWNLFLKQNKRCKLSGVEISLFADKAHKSLSTASLDRIDSNGDYTLDNIQWIHKDLQDMKMDKSQDIFIDWCRKIVEYNNI